MAGNLTKFNNTAFKNWLSKAAFHTSHDGISRDIHLDQIVPKRRFGKLDNLLFLELCCKIFDLLIPEILIQLEGFNNINSYMSLELINESDIFSGIPQKKELETMINIKLIPEIIIYKLENDRILPKNEFYRCPLPFDIYNFKNNTTIFYKEYRSFDEKLNGDAYAKELNFMIQ